MTILLGLAAAVAAGCGDGLQTEVHSGSFAPGTSSAKLQELRGQSEAMFRAAADGLCREGKLKAETFRPFRRLLVMQAAGADNSVIMEGGEAFGADALVLQFVFEQGDGAGTLVAPEAADVREALLCWDDWEGNAELCEGRLP